MIKIEGFNQFGGPFNYIDTDHYWQYATDLNGHPDMATIEVMKGESVVLVINAEIVVEDEELTLIVSPPT